MTETWEEFMERYTKDFTGSTTDLLDRVTEVLDAKDHRISNLEESLRRLIGRYEEVSGERPHTYCGCTYCVARFTLENKE